MLTRRDQLKLKEEKVKSKQAEQEAKKAAKEEAALLRKQEQEKKKAAKKAEKAEKTAKNKPKKTKGKKAPEPVMESEKDTEMEVEDQEEPSDDNAEELPKPKAKAKAKAKGKAAAKKAEPKNEPKKPRRKRMPKITAAEADEEPEGGKNDDDDDDQEPHDGVETPKKALFQSDDDGEGPDDFSGGPAPHPRVDCRTGQVKPLEEIFNGDIPSRLSKACKKKEPKVKADASAASAVDPKPKKGTKRRAQVEISPSMKKEIRRRKKKEAEVMTHAPTEDVQIQGIFLHHLRVPVSESPEEVQQVCPEPLPEAPSMWCQVAGGRPEAPQGDRLLRPVWHCKVLQCFCCGSLCCGFAFGFLSELSTFNQSRFAILELEKHVPKEMHGVRTRHPNYTQFPFVNPHGNIKLVPCLIRIFPQIYFASFWKYVVICWALTPKCQTQVFTLFHSLGFLFHLGWMD